MAAEDEPRDEAAAGDRAGQEAEPVRVRRPAAPAAGERMPPRGRGVLCRAGRPGRRDRRGDVEQHLGHGRLGQQLGRPVQLRVPGRGAIRRRDCAVGTGRRRRTRVASAPSASVSSPATWPPWAMPGRPERSSPMSREVGWDTPRMVGNAVGAALQWPSTRGPRRCNARDGRLRPTPRRLPKGRTDARLHSHPPVDMDRNVRRFCPRSRPAPRRAARSARGTASTTRSRARPCGRTRSSPGRRRARRRCRA